MVQFIIQPVQTSTDGNCFYYSLLQCYFEKPIAKENVIHFKQTIASNLTLEKVLTYIKDELKIRLFQLINNDKNLELLLETKFEESLTHPSITVHVETILNYFKHHIFNDGIWAEDWAQQYCGKVLKCNIFAFLDTCNKLTPIFEPNPNWPVIILINKLNLHWESSFIMVRKEGEEDKIIWKHSINNLQSLL